MANNRMLLVHRPSGLAVVLGKHMGWGWYAGVTQERIEALFDLVEKKCESMAEMEDFCIAMENCEADTPFVLTDWDGYHAGPEEGIFNINKPKEATDGQ